MRDLTPDGRRAVAEAADRHGVSQDAAAAALRALAAGQGTLAQFSHPELGGMVQWAQGGMVMIGDMFNNALKARVDALCQDLSARLRAATLVEPPAWSVATGGAGGAGGGWWRQELGQPSSAGSQNDLRYALFPAHRRLAVERGGRVTVYDTGDHVITGFGQQQGGGGGSATFTSQHGTVRLEDLPVVSGGAGGDGRSVGAAPEPVRRTEAAPASGDEDIFAKIERLADLKAKGILSEQEFQAKKAELLKRL
ncbi:SHOCT domain-containing protein [Caenispirillum salinarum]|uniref:SHOCT domain-containing protein n=1 Tax=Caenispirillum salinarum TaxID=859058 RepID=UPI00385078F8